MRNRAKILILFLLCISQSGYGKVFFDPPWGKDAELAFPSKPCQEIAVEAGFGVKIGEAVITFHQEVISPADGPRSHFKPSSSQYTLDAMRKYGFVRGYIMGCDRLMRENGEDWVYPTVVADYGQEYKYDPVR